MAAGVGFGIKAQWVRTGAEEQHGTSNESKAPRPPLISELEKNFLMHARMLMEMRHPHILRLRDVGLDNHNPFLVTDYVSHVTLRQVFPAGSVQPLVTFLPYLKQIASALQYAHDRHILHGDIRLENVLLKQDDQILLADFTIEEIKQNRERFNYKHIESIAYTAPEMIQGKAGPASDQYSLAIVVYELLCGELPFTKSYLEIASQQMNTPPPPLREKVPGLSSSIEKIVMTALAKICEAFLSYPGIRQCSGTGTEPAVERHHQLQDAATAGCAAANTATNFCCTCCITLSHACAAHAQRAITGIFTCATRTVTPLCPPTPFVRR